MQRLLAEDPEKPVTIKTEKGSEMGTFIEKMDACAFTTKDFVTVVLGAVYEPSSPTQRTFAEN